MTLTDIIETGCAAIAIDADGMEQPCGGPVVAVRRWTGCGDGDGIGGVCAKHAAEPGVELVPLKDIPDRPALPFPAHLRGHRGWGPLRPAAGGRLRLGRPGERPRPG